MNKISMDLDYIKYFNMTEDEIVEELEKLKSLNVTSLVIPYEIFINKELEEFKNKMLKALSISKFNLILRAQTIRNYNTTFIDDKHLAQSLIVHKQFIFNLREELISKNVCDHFSVIFQGGRVQGDNIYFYLDKAVYFFKELSDGVSKINVDILIELTQTDYKMGRLIGNKWDDIKYLFNFIASDNFGICWNMKASRINSQEYGDKLVPEKELLDKVYVSTLTNVLSYEDNIKTFNTEMQFEEIKALLKNNYNGYFHLEYIYSYIHESHLSYQNVYDSVVYLNYLLTYYNNLNKNGKLEVNLDIDKMKRRSIRREFDTNTLAILEDANFKFTRIEISEKDVKLMCNVKFNLDEKEEHKLILRINDMLFELSLSVIYIRQRDDIYDYIFKINNDDRETKKKLCELIYLTE